MILVIKDQGLNSSNKLHTDHVCIIKYVVYFAIHRSPQVKYSKNTLSGYFILNNQGQDQSREYGTKSLTPCNVSSLYEPNWTKAWKQRHTGHHYVIIVRTEQWHTKYFNLFWLRHVMMKTWSLVHLWDFGYVRTCLLRESHSNLYILLVIYIWL